MPEYLLISENCYNFFVLNYEELQPIITDDKATELFCKEDDLCKFFDFPNGNFMLKLDNRLLCRRYSIILKSKVC